MPASETTCTEAAIKAGASWCVPVAVRELTQTYHAFELFSSRHIRKLGLTTAQFSVLLVLAAGPTISCKALSEQTFITKGSLTGVLDRLEDKGLVRRVASSADRRSSFINLTDEGRVTFERVSSKHFAYLQQAFVAIEAEELASIEAGFRRFRQLFNHASRS